MEAKITPYSWLFSVAPQPCKDILAQYICGQAFNRCDREATVLGAPFPRFPCRALCREFEQACAPVFGFFPELRPNCTSQGRNAPAGMDDFPV